MQIRLTLAACLTVIPACGPQAPPPPLAAEPADWSPIGGPGWSPWITTENGEIQWNPSTAYNAWVTSLPPDQCAWPVLSTLEAATPGQSSPPLGIRFAPTPASIDRMTQETGEPPATTWTEMRAALETPAGRALIATLRDALERPYLGQPLLMDPSEETDPGNPAIVASRIPSLGSLQRHAPILCAEASRLLENDDPRGFVDTITSVHHAAKLAGTIPHILAPHTQLALEFVARDTVAWGLMAYPDRFGESLLLRLDDLLQPSVEFQTGTLRLDGHDTARRMFHPDARNNSSPIGTPMQRPVEHLPRPARAFLVGHEALVLAARGITESDWNPATQDRDVWIEHALATMPSSVKPDVLERLLLVETIATPVHLYAWKARNIRIHATGLRLALAAHRHRLRHGEFPATIAAFDPDLLPFKPSDAYSGGTLIYRLVGGTPLIYSVGPDQDDDQGRNDPYAARSSGVDWDGDLLIFPSP